MGRDEGHEYASGLSSSNIFDRNLRAWKGLFKITNSVLSKIRMNRKMKKKQDNCSNQSWAWHEHNVGKSTSCLYGNSRGLWADGYLEKSLLALSTWLLVLTRTSRAGEKHISERQPHQSRAASGRQHWSRGFSCPQNKKNPKGNPGTHKQAFPCVAVSPRQAVWP